ncbi:MAG: RnfABCDGE type electron transport complex subunit D [Phycisphaerae bacterium]|nr:RnfABCDGE type electron transport complex subunit D [Phycisphaerae bacterium]
MTEATENNKQTEAPKAPVAPPAPVEPAPPAGPVIHVAPSPHSFSTSLTTRRMMLDVLIATVPLVAWAIVQFGSGAVLQLAVCVLGCVAAEIGFTAMRGRCPLKAVKDLSAVVTGVILALSLPGTAPWYVGFIGACAAVGIGKVVFGGLGQNIFNPAMVGRAFVMICFAGALAAGAYEVPPADPDAETLDIVSQATPMSVLKTRVKDLKEAAAKGSTPAQDENDESPVAISSLFLGNSNGSIGEVSTLACLIGGLYLCLRRTAAWEIPLGVLAASAIVAVLVGLVGGGAGLSLLDFLAYHMFGGAMLFGAFYIATDPVCSPITPKGRLVFGIGLGLFIMLFRMMSTFPEGVMFAVLMMNAVVPLINRWTIPTPVGGPVPERK